MAAHFRRTFRGNSFFGWRSTIRLLVIAAVGPTFALAAGPQSEMPPREKQTAAVQEPVSPAGAPAKPANYAPGAVPAPVRQAVPIVAPAPAAAMPAPPPPVDVSNDAHQYCKNIAQAAADARFAWQAGQIKDLESQLQSRIQDLEAKEAEYRDFMARRDDAMKKAAQTLVSIYSKMKPDAAAAQISALDDDTAASVLAQLNPRISSAILNEVSPDRAVQLVNAMAAPAGPKDKKS